MRPRCLVVCFTRLIPADQGNSRRIMQLVRFYEQLGFEIDLLYHNEEGIDAALSYRLSRLFSRVVVVQSNAQKKIHEGHVCHVSEWYDPALGRACVEMHHVRGYDLVHANYVWYAPLFEHFGEHVIKVLDTHDAFGERASKYLEVNMKPQWFSTSYAEEDAALRSADAALAIQREEAAAFAARGHKNILYLPYVLPAVQPFGEPVMTRPLTLGYVASGNDWNILSMNDLLARLHRGGIGFRHPILIAGGVTPHIRDHRGVVKLGFVRNLGAFYDAIDVALNPMCGGTGLKIKTVEPLTFGKPVLSTREGCSGLTHFWKLPMYDSADAMTDDLMERFAGPGKQCVVELTRLAAQTRAALDEEYAQQLRRFSGWIRSRLGLVDQPGGNARSAASASGRLAMPSSVESVTRLAT